MAYSSDMNSLRDSYVHLTNYSINKNCAGYVANEDADMCQGHKWLGLIIIQILLESVKI